MNEIKSENKADEFEVLREVIKLTDDLPYEAAQRVFTYAVQRLNSKGGLFNRAAIEEQLMSANNSRGLAPERCWDDR
jgi:hypothetical protein